MKRSANLTWHIMKFQNLFKVSAGNRLTPPEVLLARLICTPRIGIFAIFRQHIERGQRYARSPNNLKAFFQVLSWLIGWRSVHVGNPHLNAIFQKLFKSLSVFQSYKIDYLFGHRIAPS